SLTRVCTSLKPPLENFCRLSAIGPMRGTVSNLNDTITNLDRNPQRLIFGGDTVKQYDGRTRR
ncbi:MCE family protein, partial [Rhizobium johnstonii]